MNDVDKEYILDRIADMQSEITLLRAEVARLKEHVVVEEEQDSF